MTLCKTTNAAGVVTTKDGEAPRVCCGEGKLSVGHREPFGGKTESYESVC